MTKNAGSDQNTMWLDANPVSGLVDDFLKTVIIVLRLKVNLNVLSGKFSPN